jgi:hypothetical protein
MSEHGRPIPILNDRAGAEEMQRLRDIVSSNLGDEPYEVTGVKANENGELLVTLKPKRQSDD